MVKIIREGVVYDDSLILEEQSLEFQDYLNEIMSSVDFTNISNLVGLTCEWELEQDGLRFIFRREFINVMYYSVRSYSCEIIIL